MHTTFEYCSTQSCSFWFIQMTPITPITLPWLLPPRPRNRSYELPEAWGRENHLDISMLFPWHGVSPKCSLERVQRTWVEFAVGESVSPISLDSMTTIHAKASLVRAHFHIIQFWKIRCCKTIEPHLKLWVVQMMTSFERLWLWSMVAFSNIKTGMNWDVNCQFLDLLGFGQTDPAGLVQVNISN